jgi:pyruvate formate lyase activating enzyme
MIIKSYILNSFCDWEDRVTAVIFFGGCNLRCRFCQNYPIVLNFDSLGEISWGELKKKLLKLRDFLDGVVLSGGEPTLNPDLPRFIEEELKVYFPIKLDTNGTNPGMLEELMKKKLVDYIALDVKAPLNNESFYKELTSTPSLDVNLIKESIKLLREQKSLPYEFRTTVIPTIITEKEIEEIASFIKGARKYVLQEFESQNAYDTNLRKISPYPKDKIEEFINIAKRYIDNVEIRNYKWL